MIPDTKSFAILQCKDYIKSIKGGSSLAAAPHCGSVTSILAGVSEKKGGLGHIWAVYTCILYC